MAASWAPAADILVLVITRVFSDVSCLRYGTAPSSMAVVLQVEVPQALHLSQESDAVVGDGCTVEDQRFQSGQLMTNLQTVVSDAVLGQVQHFQLGPCPARTEARCP